MENKEILDELIIGRVKPHIYAFSTNTIPNYLKIGDTYRSVSVRLNEWKQYYPELKEEYREKAIINNDIFFRDYAVHKYVENELGKERLRYGELDENIYFSNEFFKDAHPEDIKDAIKDIKKNYYDKTNKYQYYDVNTHLPEEYHYASTGVWEPRPNQKDALNKFRVAREKGRTNLLMYAVMRFGKSFTSLLCAKDMEAKIVVVVSAKADVKEEWKKTVESAENFNEYDFLSSQDLVQNEKIIYEKVSNGRRVVLFLTLQDLQGEQIKIKHKEVFENNIDLLIIDETHFGARAEKYGKVLKENKCKEDIKDKYLREVENIEDIKEETKVFKAKIKLHLSGTPYRILMGSEFTKDDIISFCQFSDIVEEQEKWDKENLLKDEWENPYYGFPQMIRFAFNPNRTAKKKLEEYKKNGCTYAFHALLEPKSISKSDIGEHKKFVNENEILELLEVIDGSKNDENILGFLDYEKIKEGSMCRHMVFVLPYCASCDAMENLIKSNSEKFKNLNGYEIINISGVENPNLYRTVNAVKNKIAECESNNIKTITLTVNRMLTGTTVEQWDTMIYLKDTISPQEYDQSIFRLQNQYIKKYVDSKGNVIKYNMKPQTLLVDFDPNRMFILQEQKALIHNANIDENGNSLLKEKIKKELKISPIITINNDKVVEITPTDIMQVVSEYSRNRGVLDETNDIPVDLTLLNYEEIKQVIEKQGELGSKQSLFVDNAEGEGDDLNIPEPSGKENEPEDDVNSTDIMNKEKTNDPVKQFRTYYARILFYSFLTESKVVSLNDIISSIENNNENKNIAKNLLLDLVVLKSINKHMNYNILNQLDYKIQNINNLSNDESVEPLERAHTAVNKFNKLSESEIVTPHEVCKNILELISAEEFRKVILYNGKFLDVASKMAEFSLAIYKRCIYEGIEPQIIKDNIYAIPTSSIAYEFIKKIYKILGLNQDNIAKLFNTYGFLNIKTDNDIDYEQIRKYILQNKKFSEIELEENMFLKEGDDKMKFDVVVGNPPYQLKGGSGGNNDALIFQHFANVAESLKPTYISLIIPSRWFSAGRENLVGEFRKRMLRNKSLEKLIVYSNASEIFEDVEIKGGVCYYLINNKYKGDCQYTLYQENMKETTIRNLNELDILIREPKISSIVNKVIKNENVKMTVDSIISNDTPFGIGSNPKSGKKYAINVYKDMNEEHNTKLFFIENQKRKVEYVKRDEITKNATDIDTYKVFIPANAGSGNDPYILGKPEVADKNSVCSQSYLYSAFDTSEEAENFVKYMKTKFFRVLVKALKITQGAPSKVYRFVPIQDFSNNSDINWNCDITQINKQLGEKYNITIEEMKYIEDIIKPLD